MTCDAVSHLILPAWTGDEIKAQQSSDHDLQQMITWLQRQTPARTASLMTYLGGFHHYGSKGGTLY